MCQIQVKRDRYAVFGIDYIRESALQAYSAYVQCLVCSINVELVIFVIFVEDFVTILRPRKEGQCLVTMVAIEASHHLPASVPPFRFSVKCQSVQHTFL
jgi:hypothetical protein